MNLECCETMSDTETDSTESVCMEVEPRHLPTSTDLKDTLGVWNRSGDVTYKNLNQTPKFHAMFRVWVEELEQYAALTNLGSNVVCHAVHLFVRYANVVRPQRSWESLGIYRSVAMWIAFKYDNAIFNPPEAMTLSNNEQLKRVKYEKIFLSRIQFNISPPRDYLEVLCALTQTSHMYTASLNVLHSYLKIPGAWDKSILHKHVCAASLMIAHEESALSLPEHLPSTLGSYTGVTDVYLLQLGEYIMIHAKQ